VSDHYLSDLPHLVGLGVASVALDIQPLTDAFLSEVVMTPTDSLSESQAKEEMTKVVESYVRIRSTTQNPLSQPIVPIHHR
jgi:hypothetical protein